MLQICLGLGILLGDAHLIQFTEGDHGEGLPGYIANSPWQATNDEKFHSYICQVRVDLEKAVEESRCVGLIAA